MKNIRYKNILALCACVLMTPAMALAQTPAPLTQETTVDILPVKTDDNKPSNVDLNANTHPPVKLTPDKSELIRLDQDATTIIVGNPDHLNVMADSARTLILVPRAPGATHFSILNQDGEVIMQRHAIIASPKKQYVRVRKACAGEDGCQDTHVFYCPDMCHEISIPSGEAPSGSSSSAAGAAQTASGAAGSAANAPETPDDTE